MRNEDPVRGAAPAYSSLDDTDANSSDSTFSSTACQDMVQHLDRLRVVAWIATDGHGEIVTASPSTQALLGVPAQALIGTKSWDLFDARDRSLARSRRQAVLRGESVGEVPMRISAPALGVRWVLVGAFPQGRGSEPDGAILSLRPFHGEMVQSRATWTFIEGIKAIERHSARSKVLQSLCNACIDGGGFLFAWYGRWDAETGLRAELLTRDHREFLSALPISDSDGALLEPLAQLAIASQRVVTSDDMPRDPLVSAVREAAELHGFHSAIAIPVFVSDHLDGVLSIYAGETEAFPSASRDVLVHLAAATGTQLERLAGVSAGRRGADEQSLMERAVQHSTDSVLITDPNGTITFANDTAIRTTGYSREELLGHNPRILQSGLTSPMVFTDMWAKLSRGEVWTGRVVNRRKDGQFVHEEATILPVQEAGHLIGYIGIHSNLTNQVTLEGRLETLEFQRSALTMAFTGMAESASLLPAAQDFCARLMTLPFIRSAHFRAIGTDLQFLPDVTDHRGVTRLDTRTESAVDTRLLEALERGPVEASGASSTGDEVMYVAPQLLAALGEPNWARVTLIGVTWRSRICGILSIGHGAAVASSGDHMASVFEEVGILANQVLAEKAHHHAEDWSARGAMTSILEQHAFQTVFQPIVDFRSEAILGYEALTRFPTQGTPAEVFERAAHLGLTAEFERACAEQAINEAQALPPDLFLTLNFSPSTLLQPATHGIVNRSTRPVIIEVTEHAAIEDYEQAMSAIRRMPNARLAVDDAGAGHSSLRHIMELKPVIVKIDISLIAGIDQRPDKRALVAGLVHFAASTGMTLVLEGVETDAERAALHEMTELWPQAIVWGQGYVWGRPAPR